MAISTPLADTRLNQLDYSNPYALQGMRAAAAAADTAQQAGNAQDSQKLTALLKGQQTDKDLAAAQKAATAGRSVHVGDASIGVDPQAQLQQKIMTDSAKQSEALNKVWGDKSKQLQGSLEQVEDGLTALNTNSVQGDKTAVAGLARLADGAGQRINQAQLASLVPSSMQGDLQKSMNYLTGQAETGFSPQIRAAFKNLYATHSNRIQKEYGDALDEFKQNAPMLAPVLAKSGQLDQYINNFGSQGQKAMGRIQDQLKAADSAPQVASPAPTGAPGIANQALSGLRALLLGHGASPQQATAAPAPQQPQQAPAQPQAPAAQGFNPDAYLQGLNK